MANKQHHLPHKIENTPLEGHHKVFNQLKKPISNFSRLSLNLTLFQLKYLAKRVAKNATFL